jgi:hypothetical protein
VEVLDEKGEQLLGKEFESTVTRVEGELREALVEAVMNQRRYHK